MTRASTIRFLAGLTALLLTISCSSPEPAPQPKPAQPQGSASAPAVDLSGLTNEQLTTKWLELAKAASMDNADLQTAVAIAMKLAESGQAALDPLLDVLADPAASPYAKVMVVASLSTITSPGMAARLITLTKPGNETTTRACATQLLINVPGPQVDAILRKLTQDEERRVRFAALRAMALRKPEEGNKALAALWGQPTTTAQERNEIVVVVARSRMKDNLPIFKEAIVDTELSEPAYMAAAMVLLRVGDESAIEPLTVCAEKNPNEEVRILAENSIKAIRERLELSQAPSS